MDKIVVELDRGTVECAILAVYGRFVLHVYKDGRYEYVWVEHPEDTDPPRDESAVLALPITRLNENREARNGKAAIYLAHNYPGVFRKLCRRMLFADIDFVQEARTINAGGWAEWERAEYSALSFLFLLNANLKGEDCGLAFVWDDNEEG